jgi:hypothetical protein
VSLFVFFSIQKNAYNSMHAWTREVGRGLVIEDKEQMGRIKVAYFAGNSFTGLLIAASGCTHMPVIKNGDVQIIRLHCHVSHYTVIQDTHPYVSPIMIHLRCALMWFKGACH